MNKQSFLTILLTMLMSMAGAKAFAHDIEVANSDGVTIYYSWTNNNTKLAVSYRGSWSDSYSNEYSGNVVIPSSVVYNGNTYSVTSIGDGAFFSCSGLTSVTIPNSVTSIGGSAFYDCSGLTSVTITNSVTSIGDYAFYYCSGLTSVKVPVTDFSSFCQNKIIRLIKENIGKPVQLIDNEGKDIRNFIVPNDVTSIGGSAFQNCSGLTSVTIPNSVTSIGDYAFQNCSNLTSVVIGSGVKSIGSSAFSSTNLKKTIWLTNTPPSGYNNAKGTVNYVSNDQFTFNNQVKYQFLSSYFDVDGIRYVPVSPSERTCDAIDCVYDESAANTKIASTVSYKGVTMNVKNILPYLAYNNMNIKTLSVDYDGELPNYAFSGCSNMQSVTLGQKLTAIGNYALEGCSSLEAVTIPDNVQTLGDYCFSGCSSLPSVIIPSAVTNINNYVFDNCTSLAKVIIADSDQNLTIGSNGSSPIFSSCPLDSVYIGRNINYNTSQNNGYSPFYRNTSLRAVKITDKETEISANEFYGCSNLQRVIIGDGVTTIGNWAFSGCQSLKFFAFGSQVANIGQEAFSDCAAVIEITSKAATPPVCGSQALDDINKWDCKLYVPKGCMASYEAADQWKDFFFKEEGDGTVSQGESGEQTVKKCKTPTISLVGDKLTFASNTEGAVFHYTVSCSDTQNGVASKDVNLTKTITVSVYATKDGYNDSEVTTSTFKVSGSGMPGDVNGDNKVDVADHVELSKIILEQGQ